MEEVGEMISDTVGYGTAFFHQDYHPLPSVGDLVYIQYSATEDSRPSSLTVEKYLIAQ